MEFGQRSSVLGENSPYSILGGVPLHDEVHRRVRVSQNRCVSKMFLHWSSQSSAAVEDLP